MVNTLPLWVFQIRSNSHTISRIASCVREAPYSAENPSWPLGWTRGEFYTDFLYIAGQLRLLLRNALNAVSGRSAESCRCELAVSTDTYSPGSQCRTTFAFATC